MISESLLYRLNKERFIPPKRQTEYHIIKLGPIKNNKHNFPRELIHKICIILLLVSFTYVYLRFRSICVITNRSSAKKDRLKLC